jgi:hypothetical protein
MFNPTFGLSFRVRGKREAFVKDDYDSECTGLYVMFEPSARNGFTSTAYCFETMVSKAEYDALKPGDVYQLQKT